MNGVLIVDKPKGLSSAKVVESVKKTLKLKKAGHTGTLDPFATGVLPIVLNNTTKLIPYFDEKFKDYEGIIHLGVTTDTLDSTGVIKRTKSVGKIKESDILNAFSKYRGLISQLPPMYSAIKQNGVRLFKLARLGKEVERKPREIYIEKLELTGIDLPYVNFFVRCSKGTYVRTLVSDIGDFLGCGAHLKELRRVSSGIFSLSEASTLDDIESGNYKLLSSDKLLNHLNVLNVTSDQANKIKNGIKITKNFINNKNLPLFKKGIKIVIKNNNEVIAVTESLVSNDKIDEINDNDIVLRVLRVII